jgi:methyl-accepting chemotaxis protein
MNLRLTLAAKLALVGILTFVPLVVLSTIKIVEWRSAIETARLERDGLEYIKAVRGAIEPLAARRGITTLALSGDSAAAPKVEALDGAIDAAMAQLRQTDTHIGNRLGTKTQVNEIAAEWETRKLHWKEMPPAENFAVHSALVQRLLALNETAVDGSGLALDPAAESFYLIDVVGLRLLPLANSTGILRAQAAHAAQLGKLDGPDRERMLRTVEQVGAREDVADFPLSRSGALDDARLAAIKGPAELYRSKIADFRTLIDKNVLGSTIAAQPQQVFASGSEVVTAVFGLYDVARSTADDIVAGRISDALRAIALTALAVLSLTAAACVLGWKVRGALVRQIGAMNSAFDRIDAGDYSSKLVAESKDEAGALVESLARMQERLRERLARDAVSAAENARVRIALDKAAANIMLADAAGKIVYANDALVALVRLRASDFAAGVRGFNGGTVVGMPLSAFLDSAGHSAAGAAPGDLRFGAATFRVQATPVSDAAGQRAGTVVQWLDRTDEAGTEAEIEKIVAEALSGTLTHRVMEEGKSGFFASLARSVNGLLETMTDMLRRIKETANAVAQGSDEISKGNADLSQRTEEQAASLEETASSMEEMTSTVRNNAENASRASALAKTAREDAEKGSGAVSSAVAAMTEISNASMRIADIIGVIDDIAFQTNLLALNAAVEAARAGDDGRGFAVVASEVRNLASRSADAAKEIKKLIQDTVLKVQEGAALVDRSGATLGHLSDSIKRVTDIVAEIAAASLEQSSGIEEVNRAIGNMDGMTQQNAAMVEQAAAAAAALRANAHQLSELTAHYQLIESGHRAPLAAVRRRSA